jgi:flagellar capping protein FliD
MNAFGSAIDSMTDPTTGSFKAEIDGFSSRNSRLQTEIADGETRITAYQTQLQNEFTQMNKMLAQYKQTATALSESTSNSSSSSSSNSVL